MRLAKTKKMAAFKENPNKRERWKDEKSIKNFILNRKKLAFHFQKLQSNVVTSYVKRHLLGAKSPFEKSFF